MSSGLRPRLARAGPSRMACVAVIVAARLFTTHTARADPWWQWMIGVDANGVTRSTRSREGGFSADARFGIRRALERSFFIPRFLVAGVGYLFYQPELITGYHHTPTDSTADKVRVWRTGGGYRLGLAMRPVEVLVVNHYAVGSSLHRPEHGFFFDVGGALDFRTPHTSIGVHSTWNHLNDYGGWVEIGMHVEVRWLSPNWD